MANETYHTTERSDSDLERNAFQWRMRLDVANEWAPNILDVLAKASRLQKLPTSHLTLDVRPDHEMPNDEARAEFRPTRILYRQSVRDRALLNDADARFTLTHELAHIILHPGLPKSRSVVGYKTPGYVTPEKNAERQADIWARAFLMPRKLMAQCSDPHEIANRFCVPLVEAIEWFNAFQISEVGKATPDHIADDIEQLRQSQYSTPTSKNSVLDPDVKRKLLWELAPVAENFDPNEYRCIDNRYIISKRKYMQTVAGGWRIKNDAIVPWDEENSR